MTKLSYWEKRHLRAKQRAIKNAQAYEKALQPGLNGAYREIAKEASSWVDKYAANEGLSSDQAIKALDGIKTKHWQNTLAQFETKAKAGGYEQELNSEYYKSRLARLSALEDQMRKLTRELAKKHASSMETALTKQYEDTYMRTTFNVQQQRGAFTSDFAHFNEDQLQTVVSRPWAKDGKDFSQRIWRNYQQELPSYLMDSLFRATVMGWGVDKVAQRMHAQFQDVKRNQIHNLVQSELGHVQEEATAKSYEESGIDAYEYMATLESHTCDVCAKLDGQHFAMKDRRVGINYPLIHARCRCTTVPWLADLPDVGERWMRDPETGKGKLIKNVTYADWKDYTNNDYLKSRPYINNAGVVTDVQVPNNIMRRTMQKAEEVIENNKFLRLRFNDQKLNIQFDDSLFIQHPDAAGVTPSNLDKTIKLNPAIHKSKESIRNYVKRNDGQFVSVKASQMDSYPVVHELGHVLHNELWDEYKMNNPDSNLKKKEFIADQIRSIYNIYEKEYGTKVTPSKLPSKYSIVNNNELFAELFTESQIGYGSNRWNQVMKKYLRKVNR
ncbi:minor capsid protein [Lactiplantibacillus sp. DA1]|uniref:minor capsid protein n=1 Tax=Lactiplantibacillus sp. DA1 TaxID=3079857 RepID=UPI00292A5E88|nr:minor capsid protein [Lactiplantibacillus sp. DA1]MDV0430113.1 minor capsid protein [Lactiplantibacillus sp. DA1]